MTTIHNPDRFMIDLRQILSQGRKRVGLLVGAGAPTAIRVNDKNELCEHPKGHPLIPDIAGLTIKVLSSLKADDRAALDLIFGANLVDQNIETILTRVRRLAQAIGDAEVYGLRSDGYAKLGEAICERIGSEVSVELPSENNAFNELVSWIGGTQREHAVEIFTPNYDLLFEEAFERAQLPYYDGFTGAHNPFFDPVSVSSDVLPPRWTKLWKIHGSLGWEIKKEKIVRTGKRSSTDLIYPDHLKYDQVARLPYSALFERLKEFLLTPDSLLLCSGFSFADAHISAVIDEALQANAHTAVIAFQYGSLQLGSPAWKIASRRSNLSVYSRDQAVIGGIVGKWQPGQPPNEDWSQIRSTFWDGKNAAFVLGDFVKLARFFALAQAQKIAPDIVADSGPRIGLAPKGTHAEA